MEIIQQTLEVERIVNLIAAFGWKVKKTDVDGDTIKLAIEKTVSPGVTTQPES